MHKIVIGLLRSKTSTRMQSTASEILEKIAVCQVTSSNDKDLNFKKCSSLIREAKSNGAKMVFLPECVDFIGASKKESFDLSEPIEGPLVTKYKELAESSKIWLSLGSLHIRNPKATEKKILNTHIVIDDQGRLAGTYDKVHLFDVDIPTFRIKESDFAFPGKELKAPVQTPVGKVGLAICYDMRFPELALSLAKSGAEILTYPSAFTVATGQAHWETLLRARAIETQCYVVAAAQIGQHNPKRSSYGHSLVIDPWGVILAQAAEGTDQIIYADINLEQMKKVRQGLPVWSHRRPEIYGELPPIAGSSCIDDQETYQFGQFTLCKSQLFYRTSMTMAFVNKMPVLNGHVLVSPLRTSALRLNDLSSAELVDFMSVIEKAQRAVEQEYDAQDSTISLQDGVLAGRSVDHLHAHILPRHVGDFKNDNDVYTELQDPTPKKRVRSAEEMAEEATRLRKYFL